MVALKASLIWRNHGYIGVSSSRKRIVRGNGSARVEMAVKATTRPHTRRTTMRRGPLRDTLDDLTAMAISPSFVWLPTGHGPHEISLFGSTGCSYDTTLFALPCLRL